MTTITIHQGYQLPIPKECPWKLEYAIKRWNASNKWMEITEECSHPLEDNETYNKYFTSFPTPTCDCKREPLLEEL